MFNMIKRILRPAAAIYRRRRRILSIFCLRLQAWRSHTTLECARSVRIAHPVRIEGGGSVRIADHVMLGYELTNRSLPSILLQARGQDAQIWVGASTTITNGCDIVAQESITIGANCLIGSETVIYDSDFHGVAPDQRNAKGRVAPVTLEDNVWVGKRAMILKVVTIGRDAVIAAGAVVVKDVPAGAIMGGNPARIIGSAYIEDKR